MIEVLKTILDSLQGQQISAVFAFIIIFTILGVSGYFIYKFMNSALINAPNYIKDKKNRTRGSVTSGEEWLKSEEGDRYLTGVIITKIKLNDERIIDKISKKVESELKIHIFQETKTLYERISKMREEYAGNYVPRKEIENLVQDIDEVRIQVAKIKGHLNMY